MFAFCEFRACLFAFCELQCQRMPISGVELDAVISKARLRRFWNQSDHEQAEGPLRAWYTHVSSKSVSWLSWADVKTDFATASIVGNCVVFNIGGNKFRLVTRVMYRSQKVFILKVLSHAEYDENKWKEECGCFNPPPKRTILRVSSDKGKTPTRKQR
jgi:mRNA interferase HigB